MDSDTVASIVARSITVVVFWGAIAWAVSFVIKAIVGFFKK